MLLRELLLNSLSGDAASRGDEDEDDGSDENAASSAAAVAIVLAEGDFPGAILRSLGVVGAVLYCHEEARAPALTAWGCRICRRRL